MKKFLFPLLLFLCLTVLGGSAVAVQHVLNDASDFPYTSAVDYDTIIFDLPGDSIELPGQALNCSGRFVRVYGRGAKVVCNKTDNTGWNRSVLTNSYYGYFDSLTVYSAVETDSGYCWVIGATKATTLKDCSGITNSPFESCALLSDCTVQLWLDGGAYSNYSHSFTNREYWWGYAIAVGTQDDASPWARDSVQDFRYRFENLTINAGSHGGITAKGGRMIFRNITIHFDAQNDLYDTTTSDALGEGVANSFGIAVDNYCEGSEIVKCTVVTGTTEQGGRGIFFNDSRPESYNATEEWCAGTSDIRADSNYLDVSQGYDDYYRWGDGATCYGVQVEENNDNVLFRWNYVKTTCSTSLASYRGNKAISFYATGTGDNLTLVGNRIIASANSGVAWAYALCIERFATDSPIVLQENYYESPMGPVVFGGLIPTGRGGGNNVVSIRDTINHTAAYTDSVPEGPSMTSAAITVHPDTAAAINNIFIDPVFLNDDSTVTLQPEADGPSEIILAKTLAITVLGSNLEKVPNAVLTFSNAYGTSSRLYDTTDGLGGAATAIVRYRYYQDGLLADSTYNPLRISAKVGSDSVVQSWNVYPNTNRLDTLALTATLGTVGTNGDVIENRGTLNSATNERSLSLGIPRENISASEEDSARVVLVTGGYGVSGTACVRTYSDHFKTKIDSGLNNILDDHTHHTYRGDTIIAVTPWPVSGSTGKRVFRVKAYPFAFLDSVTVDSADQVDTQGGLDYFGNSDSILLIGRNPDAMGIWTWVSADKGRTFASRGLMVGYNSTCRYDIDQFGDSNSVTVFVNNRYIWHLLYKSTTPIETDTIYAGGATTLTRLYSSEIGKDGTVHVAFSDLANPSHLITAWRNPTTGVWTIDTLWTAATQLVVGGECWVAWAYSAYAEKMRLFYGIAENSAVKDSADQIYLPHLGLYDERLGAERDPPYRRDGERGPRPRRSEADSGDT